MKLNWPNAMGEHTPKIIIVALMLLIVGVPFALRPAAAPTEVVHPGQASQLVLFSPHNEQIRFEISRAFNQWRVERGEPPVEFDWRSSGGTSDLRKAILAQFEAAARGGTEDAGIGADLMFGGGEFEHDKLVQGVTVVRDGQTMSIPVSVPVELPPGLLEAAFPEPHIGGERLYHPKRHWIGVVLSSFGIVYNRDVLAMKGLDEPETWADLGDPRYLGWIALADPAHSGAIAVTYDTILRRLGWNDGWALLRRSFANARYFTASASKVPVDVSAGEAAAGMCIDFYGRFQAGAVNSFSSRVSAAPDRPAAASGPRVGYVDPAGLTATTADPISMLRGAPNRETATQFIAWLLSPDAQRLWQRSLDAERPGNPRRFELRRQPIRRDLYTPDEKAHWTDPDIDPFAQARPLAPHMQSFYNLVAPVSHAMAIDVHEDLTAAWRAIQAAGVDHPHRDEMLTLFDAMPPELTFEPPETMDAVEAVEAFKAKLADRYRGSDRLLDDRIAWSIFFRNNYRRIVELASR